MADIGLVLQNYAGLRDVTARLDGNLIGYVHGVTLPADKPWWGSLGDARDDRGELPAQVVRIPDTRVEPEAVGGRVLVGGVADEEDPALAEPIGNHR